LLKTRGIIRHLMISLVSKFMTVELEEKTYETCDLYFAAFLQCAGCDMLKTRKEKSKFFFVFQDLGGISQLKNEYFGRRSKVDALSYADRVQSLKSLVHS